MSDTPTTFRAEPADLAATGWDDQAELHRADDAGGLLQGMKAIRKGTVAELVRFVMTLPEADRPHYAIQKAGDRLLGWGDIAALAQRSDYPG